MDKHNDFQIKDCGGYYTITNIKAKDFDNYHAHINKKSGKRRNYPDTCKMLIKMVCKCKIPNSKFLRESAKRISRNPKYIEEIEIKEEKDSQKPKFHKVNNGKW